MAFPRQRTLPGKNAAKAMKQEIRINLPNPSVPLSRTVYRRVGDFSIHLSIDRLRYISSLLAVFPPRVLESQPLWTDFSSDRIYFAYGYDLVKRVSAMDVSVAVRYYIWFGGLVCRYAVVFLSGIRPF